MVRNNPSNMCSNAKCDSNMIDYVPQEIFSEVYCLSDNKTLLGDCSVNFDYLPCFETLDNDDLNNNSCPFDDYQSNEDNLRIADYVPETPCKRKWQEQEQEDEESAYDWSTHSFAMSPIKSDDLPPKKAIKLAIKLCIDATPSTNDEGTAAQLQGMDDHFDDPLLTKPLKEIATGFDTIKTPKKIQSDGSRPVAYASKADTPSPIKIFASVLKRTGAPREIGKVKPTVSKTANAAMPFSDLRISRPWAMLQQQSSVQHQHHEKHPSFQRLPFPQLDDSPFNGEELRFENSKFPFQMQPRSNHSNPSNQNPPSSPSSIILPYMPMVAPSNAFTPIPAMEAYTVRKWGARHPVTVSPEPLKAVEVKKTPASDTSTKKSKSIKSKNDKGNEQWNKRYQEAKEFAQAHGHCIIPNNYPANPDLGSWSKRQKYQYLLFFKNKDSDSKGGRKSTLTKQRIKMLESIGFCWNHKDSQWDTRYRELLRFVNKNGHAAVPTKYSPNQGLASWVKIQRRQYKLFMAGKPSSLTQTRIKLLNKIEFVWNCLQKEDRPSSPSGKQPANSP